MAFPRTVQAVVFDMDGLLIDSEVLVRTGVRRAAAILGVDFSDALYGRMMGTSGGGYDVLLKAQFGDDFPVERFLELERTEVQREVAAGVCLKAGVVELVDHLGKLGLPIAVATSSQRAWAEQHLGGHGLIDRFAAIVAREDVPVHKPHPAPFLEAARRLGVEPANCLALEDSHNGVRAAHAAGMMTVMVPDLLDATEEMHDLCIHIAASLHEVLTLVERGR